MIKHHLIECFCQDVSVAPFCTVGSSAKLRNGCKLYPSSHIFGNTELGDSCVLMTLGMIPFFTSVITMRSESSVRFTDHRSPPIKRSGAWLLTDMSKISGLYEVCSYNLFVEQVIGENNLIMGSCHIAHDCKIGDNNIFANNTLLAGLVVVEDYTHTAGAIVVHQFCHIGSLAFIGGGFVVSQDVPKYMMVNGERAEIRGLNLGGLRRSRFTISEIRSLKRAYRKISISSDAVSLGTRQRSVESPWCGKWCSQSGIRSL
ncbi:PREDICTED: probable acyl-[acyl-carrier-protein]--UDP-N-acetylglucosamine O-acyltransferase, mitochondrial isoform X2 [Tarenaya hassleriana]|uniref:probable acyl-[acyl-carrier-protein]--UDP-N-acetylglucosamine O-acyltransferase, mitochondrial isoform X2 n=1 Tax=Tarenaya hassleriana TaxID=28532 RepID=UPI0008FD2309|nr:PREDICTED: probable acyl-[acyl-carrier-protein]--UDP-N-acetylglucosamine O-acyltransferase, mitochondrial isoform X2 [Tarenaya hassleriana]XP_019058178.1 PREDICTED: probable acyl-[acyl-carrier-protein]--UDP-N-acetylglucosamine O-acyltransferase, mitochondrial isoform X2 [Tarenaya hassleriana]